MRENDVLWAALGLREEAAVFESASQSARAPTEGCGAVLSELRGAADQPVRRQPAGGRLPLRHGLRGVRAQEPEGAPGRAGGGRDHLSIKPAPQR